MFVVVYWKGVPIISAGDARKKGLSGSLLLKAWWANHVLQTTQLSKDTEADPMITCTADLHTVGKSIGKSTRLEDRYPSSACM